MSVFFRKIICVFLLLGAAPLVRSQANQDLELVSVGKMKWSVLNLGEQLLTTPEQVDSVLVTLRTMLVTALQKSRQFQVVDREDTGSLVKEFNYIYDSGMVDSAKAIEWGKQAGADHLILGNVTQFSHNKRKKGVMGIGGQSSQLMMTVDLRVVNTKSGEILVAEEVKTLVVLAQEFSMGTNLNPTGGTGGVGFGGGFGTENGLGQQLEALIRESAENVVAKIIATIKPIEIIQIHGKSPVLNYGSSMFDKGDVVNVYRSEGDPIVVGGKQYPPPKVHMGQLRITDAHADIAMCEVLGGLRPGDLKVGDECTKATDREAAVANKLDKKQKGKSK